MRYYKGGLPPRGFPPGPAGHYNNNPPPFQQNYGGGGGGGYNR